MTAEGITIDDARDVADALGLHLVAQKSKHDGEVKFLIRPAVGSNRWRAITTTGRAKPGLCLHGHYLFMSRLFAAHPAAVLNTWVRVWTFDSFGALALAWTRQQMKEEEGVNTCDCTPDMVSETMVDLGALMRGEATTA